MGPISQPPLLAPPRQVRPLSQSLSDPIETFKGRKRPNPWPVGESKRSCTSPIRAKAFLADDHIPLSSWSSLHKGRRGRWWGRLTRPSVHSVEVQSVSPMEVELPIPFTATEEAGLSMPPPPPC